MTVAAELSTTTRVERLRERGVLASLYGPTMLRFVTNRDATRDQVKEASDITVRLFEEIIEEKKGTLR